MKNRKKAKPRKATTFRHDMIPKRQENDILLLVRAFFEHYPMTCAIENSYVLSRFWAWFSQIQLSPNVHIPVPRFLTYRDP